MAAGNSPHRHTVPPWNVVYPSTWFLVLSIGMLSPAGLFKNGVY